MNTQKMIDEFTEGESSVLWWISEHLCEQSTSIKLLNNILIQNPELHKLCLEAEEDRKTAVQMLHEEISCNHSEHALDDWDIAISDTVENIEREVFFRGLLLGIRLQKECGGI